MVGFAVYLPCTGKCRAVKARRADAVRLVKGVVRRHLGVGTNDKITFVLDAMLGVRIILRCKVTLW